MNRFLTAVAIAAAIAFGSSASAAVVSFDGLPGNNGDDFSSYSEDGFDIAADTGAWRVGKIFGNPVPSVYSSGTASLSVMRTGGGLFSLSSLDFAGAGGGTISYAIKMFKDGALAMSANGSGGPGFFNFVNPFADVAFDNLIISITATSASSFNVDNIVLEEVAVAPVPLPASLGFLLAGLGGLAVARRKTA